MQIGNLQRATCRSVKRCQLADARATRPKLPSQKLLIPERLIPELPIPELPVPVGRSLEADSAPLASLLAAHPSRTAARSCSHSATMRMCAIEPGGGASSGAGSPSSDVSIPR